MRDLAGLYQKALVEGLREEIEMRKHELAGRLARAKDHFVAQEYLARRNLISADSFASIAKYGVSQEIWQDLYDHSSTLYGLLEDSEKAAYANHAAAEIKKFGEARAPRIPGTSNAERQERENENEQIPNG